MKAKELAELLLKNPDFEVETCLVYYDRHSWSSECKDFIIDGISDIGYSEQIIQLSSKEK